MKLRNGGTNRTTDGNVDPALAEYLSERKTELDPVL